MICDVCPRCGTFVLQFTRCACPLESPSGVSKAPSAAGAAPRSAAVEVRGVRPKHRPPANPDVSREAQLEQCLALARDALNNSSDIVFQDTALRHLRTKALAEINKLIGPSTWPFN